MTENNVTVRLAKEIVRYLRNRPEAADTIEGISTWWLMEQRFQDSAAQVQKALDYLEARNLVQKDTSTGRVVYRSTPKTHSS